MKFNGSEKQNKWSADILKKANLTDDQIDNLLRFAGPTMHSQGIMDTTIVIEHRGDELAAYADQLGRLWVEKGIKEPQPKNETPNETEYMNNDPALGVSGTFTMNGMINQYRMCNWDEYTDENEDIQKMTDSEIIADILAHNVE